MADEQATNIETDTLRGDVRDAVLTEFKQVPKPWQQMTEDEQDRLIHRANDIAGTVVRRAVDLVAARGLPALAIEVGKITIDGGDCKGAFECYADDENLLRIRHLQGKRAMFVMASPDQYFGESKPAEPDNVGDLAMPKEQPLADAMAEAIEADTTGKPARKRGNGHKPPKAALPDVDTSNPPFNGDDDEPRVADPGDDGIPEQFRRTPAA